ncbi:MAG: hypothetical protein ACRC8Y_02580 [Chroococcales cyanobacterium]
MRKFANVSFPNVSSQGNCWGDGGDVQRPDFSRCQECDGGCHHTSNRRVYSLSAWGLVRSPPMGVTWHQPSHAVTTQVVTTNRRGLELKPDMGVIWLPLSCL